MLTWRENTVLVYDLATLQHIETKTIKTYNGEGWGLAFDGEHLIASDGSQYLSFYDVPGSDDLKMIPVKMI
jgi:glutamine cyclotransferase